MADPVSQASDVEEDVEDVEEVEGAGEGGGEQTSESSKMAAQLMKNPQVLAALQDKVGSAASPSAFIHSLPKAVQRRLKALKKLQNEVSQVESQFCREVHELECQYAASYAPLHDKRGAIVRGEHEPSEEECDWPSEEEEDSEEKLAEKLKKEAVITDAQDDNTEKKDVRGVPGFWLTIFQNVDLLRDMVQPHDEPILTHLQDITVQFSEGQSQGFTLTFHFEPNEYFTETVLTKHYSLRIGLDPTDPFAYDGPEIVRCFGCPMTWKKGKNVTVKVVKKKQKHKGRGQSRTVTKTVPNDSFFNFFNPPEVPEEQSEEDVDEDMEELLAADFEIGHFIRERIVPRAVLYFTGEALDSDEFEEEEENTEGDFNEEND